MKLRTRWLAILTLALATVATAPPPAQASHVVDTTVTGRVSEVRGSDALVVNGRTFRVLPGSPAAKTIGEVRSGMMVELVLNGDPSKDATRVIVINLQNRP